MKNKLSKSRSQVRKFNVIIQSLKTIRKSAKFYDVSYRKVFYRALYLFRTGMFIPSEAFQLGLFDPNFSDCELCKYTSRRKLTRIQSSINPTAWESITEDKSVFYKYCMALGVPIPQLYATFFKETAGWSVNELAVRRRDDWKRFFEVRNVC